MCLPSFSFEGDSMRFRYSVCGILGIMLALILAGCATKERMANSTMRISVSPTGTEMLVSATQQFSAQATNAGNSVSTSVRWSVEGGDTNGTITQTGFYTAPSTINHPLSVTIKAEQDGVTGTAVIRVSTRSDAEKEFSKKRFYLYQDEYPTIYLDSLPNTTEYLLIESNGYLGVWGATVVEDTSYAFEGMKSEKITNSTGNGGFYLQFGYPSVTARDMSLYANGKLHFAVRLAPSAQMWVKLEWTGGSALVAVTGLASDTWEARNMDLTTAQFSGLNLNSLEKVTFVFTTAAATYVDDIYFKKA